MSFADKQQVFHDAFELERQKIPRFMRMTDSKKQILMILGGIFIFILLLVIMWFPRWLGATVIYGADPATGEAVVTKMYYNGYYAAIILASLPILAILVYLFFAYLFEKTAEKDANIIAIKVCEDRRLQALEEDRKRRQENNLLPF